MQIRKNPTKRAINHHVHMAHFKARSSEVIIRTDMIGITAKMPPELVERGYRMSMLRNARRLNIPFKLRQWMFESPMKMSDAVIALIEQLVLEKENGAA